MQRSTQARQRLLACRKRGRGEGIEPLYRRDHSGLSGGKAPLADKGIQLDEGVVRDLQRHSVGVKTSRHRCLFRLQPVLRRCALLSEHLDTS